MAKPKPNPARYQALLITGAVTVIEDELVAADPADYGLTPEQGANLRDVIVVHLRTLQRMVDPPERPA
jgi:hypothetical protein